MSVPTSINDDGFVLVISSSKSKRKRSKGTRKSTNHIFHSSGQPEDSTGNVEINIDEFLRRFDETENDFFQSEFFRQTVSKIVPILELQNIRHIICLGLGRLSECTISRHQLAFVRGLQKQLPSVETPIQFYDPIFSQQETDIIQRLGAVVLTENLEGKYSAAEKTLFYLPHCPKQITNNLLWKNWNQAFLGNVFLIGNSFESIISNTPKRLLKSNSEYLLNIADFCKETKLDNIFKFKDIFNDTSLHCFDITVLSQQEASFWEAQEPCYAEDDLELISKSIQQNLELTNKDGS
ncbi:SRR1-like protein [Uranotaenia lowii]|uniref:SRR1-like protein n=1 Tax=Uranotaenia lowii TaxID=190385 RepID=UPI002478CD2E|nr:SRR1-like protein [Uranotaenia lowii]